MVVKPSAQTPEQQVESRFKKAVLDERIRRKARETVDKEQVKAEITLIPASQVKRERIQTFFGGRLLVGAFQMMVGPGEAGKGMVSTDIVARFSTGDAFPGETVGREAMNVIVCVTEDSKERMRGRLEAAGADLDRVFFAEGPPIFYGGLQVPSPIALGSDAGVMMAKTRECGAKVLFFETMLEHLGDRDAKQQMSTNNEFDVRRAMSPVISLCKETGLIGWGVMHPRKSIDGGIEDSISGSAAFRNVSRGVLHVYKDPTSNGAEDLPSRLFLCSKTNYLPRRPTTLRFRIEPWVNDPSEGRVVWSVRDLLDPRSAEDIWREINDSRKQTRRQDHAIVDAEKFLRDFLAAGPRTYEEIVAASVAAGISSFSLKKAKQNLNIDTLKSKTYPAKVLGWSLPQEEM